MNARSDAGAVVEGSNKEIGAWVDLALKSARISYAKASAHLGLPDDAISKIVRGVRDLSALELMRLCELTQYPLPSPVTASEQDLEPQTGQARMEMMPDRIHARIKVNEIVPYETALEIMRLLKARPA